MGGTILTGKKAKCSGNYSLLPTTILSNSVSVHSHFKGVTLYISSLKEQGQQENNSTSCWRNFCISSSLVLLSLCRDQLTLAVVVLVTINPLGLLPFCNRFNSLGASGKIKWI